jgi:hypothetical protein
LPPSSSSFVRAATFSSVVGSASVDVKVCVWERGRSDAGRDGSEVCNRAKRHAGGGEDSSVSLFSRACRCLTLAQPQVCACHFRTHVHDVLQQEDDLVSLGGGKGVLGIQPCQLGCVASCGCRRDTRCSAQQATAGVYMLQIDRLGASVGTMGNKVGSRTYGAALRDELALGVLEHRDLSVAARSASEKSCIRHSSR